MNWEVEDIAGMLGRTPWNVNRTSSNFHARLFAARQSLQHSAPLDARTGYGPKCWRQVLLLGRSMDRPLKEHIANLERRLQALNGQLMESTRTLAERNRIESEIR